MRRLNIYNIQVYMANVNSLFETPYGSNLLEAIYTILFLVMVQALPLDLHFNVETMMLFRFVMA